MKSNVSDYLVLVTHIYRDATSLCTADVSDLRDLKTIRSRVKDEGLSFLTITLPSFCADFDKSLERGFIDSKCFRNFGKYRAIPHFLRGMLSRIFDLETGRIYDQTDDFTSAVSPIISCVRQICLAFKKVELSCAPKRNAAALNSFVTVEHSFEMFSLPREERESFSRVSSMLWGNMLHDLRVSDVLPRHGPGATADRITGNQKYVWRRWHERLEPYFPIAGLGYINTEDVERQLEGVSFVSSEREQPVRVTLVPKTLKGPRVIAIEPSCMQYTQQGIRAELYARIESNWLTGQHINFTDQTINQSHAMSGSKDGLLATIDLSDASDRVPRDLALEMFRCNPDLRDAIDACRSTHAELPSGAVIGPLRKFASMGSALCFPVEAMYFYTICVKALLRAQSLPETYRSLEIVGRQVYVYGDDIIVPSAYADTVIEHLQWYNCKVNSAKTFVSGKFRESCGVEAYAGYDVTPTYVRQEPPDNRRQVSRLISWVATANLFYKRGFWSTAQHMFSRVERHLGKLPYVSETSGLLGRFSFLGYRTVERWSVKYQRLEVKAWCPRSVRATDRIEGNAALMKSLLKLEGLIDLWAERDARHLERFELHGEVAIQRRWSPVT